MLKKGHFNLGVKADTLTLSEQSFKTKSSLGAE